MFSPEIIASYSPINRKKLSELSKGSDFEAKWVCSLGHNYSARVNSRVKGSGCPYCAGRKPLTGFNDLATINPEIAKQWDKAKNLPLTPQTITAGSGKKVWWLCSKEHSWEATVHLRTAGSSCPYCSGRKATPGVNDLLTTHPELAKEWHPTKNSYIATEISAGSRKKVWWQCSEGHEWETILHSRGILGTKCPYCVGRKATAENNLTITHPHLQEQWSKTNETLPTAHTYGETTKAWWVCSKGHKWETQIKTRSENKNCPVCATVQFISSPEKEINQYLSHLDFVVENNTRSIIPPYELDAYIPEKQLAVEFNGLYWHSEKFKPKTYHYDKWLACKEKGIQLVQIWEDDWNRNPELVKRMLTHKLGVSQDPQIYARNTTFAAIDSRTRNLFFTENHIQGSGKGTHCYGLFWNNELVAAIIVALKKNELEIIRFATSKQVTGGFSKLLANTLKLYSVEKVTTFSDNTISNGNLYAVNGFTIAKTLPADYMYLVKGERKHKFGYRLNKFKNNTQLQYSEGMTEKELAELNNLPRVWDAGKIKWEKVIIF